ncbi:aspartate aminotransferase family protein [Persicirhabdus sediminis]|uniref:Acetylornithine/succinylornithine family transaminase n=1 Tax=Persicirhabdus sediminis TaxID=454144 RepID=A0A8J7MF86_9BACT|nr:acetylornithine/succinylornithine family transaminase [Persicirhabdus sediminis]MBK1791603.1 acetylornithine/succinylornithine family transaminase [Persicirhabdus sediminis]
MNTADTYSQFVLPTYGRFQLVPERAEGVYLWDNEGKRYLDFCTGIATCSVGHCHPAVTKAIQDQAATLVHCSNLYQIPQQAELAKLLVEKFVGTPGKVFFGNSGAEANDGMIKTARRYGHARPNANGEARYEIITFDKSFHGRTLGSMSATAQEKIQVGFTPLLAGFRYVPFNDSSALADAIGEHTVGIMFEPVQGEGGVNVADESFITTISQLADKHDLLLLLDEVQAGLGRCGTKMGYQAVSTSLKPDIVSWAKGLGGGIPIGAFWVSDRSIDDDGTTLSSLMGPGSHGSTYGGNPLVSAGALAVLKEILQLEENIHAREKQIRETIASWNHPLITEVRGKGLLLGIGLVSEKFNLKEGQMAGLKLCAALMDAGMLTVPAGPDTLRLLPPLNVTEQEIDDALTILKTVLDSNL